MKKIFTLFLCLSAITSQLYSENLDTIFNNVARLFKQEKYVECYEMANDLYDKSMQTTDTVLVFNSLYYMGFSCQRMGNMNEALEYNLQAYDIASELRMLDLQSSVLNNIGNVYMVSDKDSVAAVYFQKSIDIERELGRNQQLAVRLGNISTAYMKMGKYEQAINAAEEGLRIDMEAARPNKIAVRLNQLGEVYHAGGRLKEAKQCELDAYEYFQEVGSVYGMSIVLHALGKIYADDRKQDSAVMCYDKAMEYAKSINNRLLVQKVSRSMCESLKKTDPVKAMEYFELYVNIKDSIFDAENQKLLNDFQVRYDLREKESEIEKQKQANENHRNIIKLTMLIFVLLFILIIMLVINIITRKRKNAALMELDERKNKSLSILSHDLKNPVIAQKLVLHQLSDNIDSISREDAITYITALTESVESLEELLTNLLEWTVFERKLMKYQPIKFDIKAQCFDEIIPLYKYTLNKKNIVVKEYSDISLENHYVFSDIKMVSTVLRNLISNALKYSNEGDEVSVCFKDEGDDIRIVVKDMGVGVSEDRIQQLLSGMSFSTLGTNGEEGNGIGLEIVNRMLHHCKSELDIKSVLGHGSEFSFRLKKGDG